MMIYCSWYASISTIIYCKLIYKKNPEVASGFCKLRYNLIISISPMLL